VLPELQQAALDSATLDALFVDLASCAHVLSVVPKRASRSMVEESPIDLAAACAGLRDGSLRGVQIRYRFEGREWCDTLQRLPDGPFRLVRICTDDIAAPTG
jgi:hypothetical protein